MFLKRRKERSNRFTIQFATIAAAQKAEISVGKIANRTFGQRARRGISSSKSYRTNGLITPAIKKPSTNVKRRIRSIR